MQTNVKRVTASKGKSLDIFKNHFAIFVRVNDVVCLLIVLNAVINEPVYIVLF